MTVRCTVGTYAPRESALQTRQKQFAHSPHRPVLVSRRWAGLLYLRRERRERWGRGGEDREMRKERAGRIREE